jgi:hypothetical protein
MDVSVPWAKVDCILDNCVANSFNLHFESNGDEIARGGLHLCPIARLAVDFVLDSHSAFSMPMKNETNYLESYPRI